MARHRVQGNTFAQAGGDVARVGFYGGDGAGRGRMGREDARVHVEKD